MFGQPNTPIVNSYVSALQELREEWELTELEEEAYQRLLQAQDRLDEFEYAQLNDLYLQDAIRLAHRALTWPGYVPVVAKDLPGIRIGRYYHLNAAIICYEGRYGRHCHRIESGGSTLSETEVETLEILREARDRIETCRNADLTDLPLLATLQSAHRQLGLDPCLIPQVDVTRYYEGPTSSDGIDVRNQIDGLKKGLSHAEICEIENARSERERAVA